MAGDAHRGGPRPHRPFMAAAMRRANQKDLKALKALLERA